MENYKNRVELFWADLSRYRKGVEVLQKSLAPWSKICINEEWHKTFEQYYITFNICIYDGQHLFFHKQIFVLFLLLFAGLK